MFLDDDTLSIALYILAALLLRDHAMTGWTGLDEEGKSQGQAGGDGDGVPLRETGV